MKTAQMKRLNKAAWKKWGTDAQLGMLVEECAELIVAVAKLSRHNNGSSLRDVAEEIADVEICLDQCKQMLDPAIPRLVGMYKNTKYNRLNQLIEGQHDLGRV